MRRIPRVSTRGCYDLATGRTMRRGYRLYPKKAFEKLYGAGEIVVVVHGLRNDEAGALAKFRMVQGRLRKLGYVHPVAGYTYDSNTRGAHAKKTELRALRTGQIIARKNGRVLARFMADFKARSPGTRMRLVGHSLGTQVIQEAIAHTAGRGAIESAHLFGASIDARFPCPKKHGGAIQRAIHHRITNYYAPSDDVLLYASAGGAVKRPLGLDGAAAGAVPKYRQVRASPKNHRFASYMAVLRSFP